MFASLPTDKTPGSAVIPALGSLLTSGAASAVLVLSRHPYSGLPMPTLISDPEKLENADPFAPAAPFNAARQASMVTRSAQGKKIALVLRPCEIRAWVELNKLHQNDTADALIIGIDCPGRMENSDYLDFMKQEGAPAGTFFADPGRSPGLVPACGTCTRFTPENCDLAFTLFGHDPGKEIGVLAMTDAGDAALKEMNLKAASEPAGRQAAIDKLLSEREEAQTEMFEKTEAAIGSVTGLSEVLANCLNCLGCRTACPVCYCKECVFLTDVFAHKPEMLLRRAGVKGAVKLPTETLMFHITRMAHMSHACVMCGHCTSVCPSSIPVGDIFKTVAARTQELFDYLPGRRLDEPIPYQVYETQG